MVVDRNSKQRPIFLTQYLERYSASSDQHMKKLMSFREGLHVMVHCCMRQYFADRCWLHEHLGGHAPRREPTKRNVHEIMDHVPRARTTCRRKQSESKE